MSYLIAKGHEHRREQRLDEARAAFSEAIAQALCGLAQIDTDQKRAAAALRNYKKAADIYRKLNHPLRLAHTIRHIGDVLRRQNRFLEAGPHYVESLHIYRAHPETKPLDLANAIRGYALLKEQLGSPRESIDLWREAIALYAAQGIEAGIHEGEARIARLIAPAAPATLP